MVDRDSNRVNLKLLTPSKKLIVHALFYFCFDLWQKKMKKKKEVQKQVTDSFLNSPTFILRSCTVLAYIIIAHASSCDKYYLYFVSYLFSHSFSTKFPTSWAFSNAWFEFEKTLDFSLEFCFGQFEATFGGYIFTWLCEFARSLRKFK